MILLYIVFRGVSMKIFTITGLSKTGKTTTAEHIIARLVSLGYRVGSVKEIHYEAFAMDTPGSDTDRHAGAGAGLVTARGHNKTDILYKYKLPISRVIGLYREERYDYLVMEGVRDADVPMIVTGETEAELDERFCDNVFAFAGKISSRLGEYRGLPVFDARSQTDRLLGLLESTLERQKTGYSIDPQR